MFKRIATGDSGRPVVLSEFNFYEQMAMEHILLLAKQYLPSWRMDETAFMITEVMIKELAKTYGIEVS